MIVADSKKKKIREYQKDLERRLIDAKIEIVSCPTEADIFIALGGDGTMLRAIHEFQRFGKPFVGENFGWKGFLMNDQRDDFVEMLQQRRYSVHTLPLLELKATTTRGHTVEDLSINDVAIKPLKPAGSCKIMLSVNGRPYGDKPIMGDGIIVSTALGSTAYNLSAGGPVVTVGSEVFSLTPNNVHTPIQIEPTIVRADSVIEVEILEPKVRKALAACDGREYHHVAHVTIRQSQEQFQLIFLEGEEDFMGRLFNKIMKAQ